ncbi:MAG: hypothetical protein BAA01_12435 [Bacillus thermozeamaize]|uniref:NlpC/P60 domain-containing protein n=1 Tax=Bacillus thermozeamaize TaxID=230954 RepID=A0A1Y3PJF5_9BACI|nr:MAG: hypothetical protein BAA01_12435 [Bacillus thermozeamaize]
MLIWLISAAFLVQGLFLALSVPTADAAAATSNAASRSAVADRIIATGMKYIGTPYYFGARSGDTRRFDCSSFTQYVYGVNGIKLPRTSRQQAQVGTYVPRSQVQKGDLVFFSTKRNGRIDHVAIYMGDSKLLHAITRPGVTVSKVTSYWSNTYVGARRVIQ